MMLDISEGARTFPLYAQPLARLSFALGSHLCAAALPSRIQKRDLARVCAFFSSDGHGRRVKFVFKEELSLTHLLPGDLLFPFRL